MPNNDPVSFMRLKQAGFSLFELVIVIAIMSIFAALAMPLFTPSVATELQAAAEILLTDCDYARDLSITHNSNYQLEFAPGQPVYSLKHSGSNHALNKLPETAFNRYDNVDDEQFQDFRDLPGLAGPVRIAAVHIISGQDLIDVTNVEFNPMGSTTRIEETVVWLTAGQGENKLYVPVHIPAITGISRIGTMKRIIKYDDIGAVAITN